MSMEVNERTGQRRVVQFSNMTEHIMNSIGTSTTVSVDSKLN